jgi:hypothetical protein
MRNVIYAINITLDGCCDHTKQIADEETHEYFTHLMRDVDLLVFGRKTYQLMVPFWPEVARSQSMSEAENEFARTFDSITKIVFSRSLASAEVGRIRSLPGGPMAETFEAYRTRVLSYLGDEEPIGVQQATPSQLDRRLRDVAPEELIRRPAPEKWSIAEIVAHLADAELAMGWRLRNMLANPGVALTWWDQAVWAERLGYAQQDASLSAGVFRALRESNLRLLESVPRARWVECYGVHEVRGRQTVEEFVRLEAAHDLNHLRQIDRILGGCMEW